MAPKKNNINESAKVFLLNGPPDSGKDTLANYIISLDRTSSMKNSFAFPIKAAMTAFFSLSDDELRELERNKTLKNTELARFLGSSWRGVCIDFAEKFAKKVYGDDIFSKLLVLRLKKVPMIPGGMNFIISDCGFEQELPPLIEAFGKDNVHGIKLAAKNCDYSIDSRGYVDFQKYGVSEHYLFNKKNQAFFHDGYQLIKLIQFGQNPLTTPFSSEVMKTEPKKSTKSRTKKAK